jgi:hypothetical protein
MLRKCDACQTEYVAKRRSSKYCSERCKKRAQRGPAIAPVVPIVAAPSASAEVERGPLEAATFAELVAVKQETTSAGVAALSFAKMIDNPGPNSLASVAAISREHSRKLGEAIAAGSAKADPLDELAKQREERRARA